MLEIVAAGGYHLFLVGSLGCGKILLVLCLFGLLPEVSEAEVLETVVITFISGRGLDLVRWWQWFYWVSYHIASVVALVGGGMHPRPGEILLAYNGVLFLDELPEWQW